MPGVSSQLTRMADREHEGALWTAWNRWRRLASPSWFFTSG